MNEPKKQNNHWFELLSQRPGMTVTLLLGLWIVALASIWGLYGNLEERFETGVFLGRLHILILHLPIGLVTGAFVVELLRFIPAFKISPMAARSMLWLGFLGSIGASLAGYLLMQSDQYTGKFMTLHLWSGLGVVVLTACSLLLKNWKDTHPLYYICLAATFVLITVSSHYGGNMVHGESYLTEFAPEPIAKILGETPEKEPANTTIALDDRLLYQDVIQPIFNKKCTECHYEGKIKGDLRMDSFEWLAKGGEAGPAFIAGDLDGSEIYYRVTVDPDDDDIMPPDGKGELLTPQEIEILALWISKGATDEMTIGDASPNDSLRKTLEALFNQEN